MRRLRSESSCAQIAAALAMGFALAALAVAGPARAGGLYVNEFGTHSMGVAGAGAEALAEDASTAFPLHNPAGMTRLEGKNLTLGAGLFVGDVKFDPDGNTPIPGNSGGQQGGLGPLLGSFYVHSLSDRWKLGASVFSLTGAVLDPDNQWAGRFALEEISFLTLSFNGAVAFKVNDWLSVAAGGTMMYATLDVKLAVPPPDGDGQVHIDDVDDWKAGWNAGVLLTPREGTRIGLIYQSEIEPDLTGDVKVRPVGADFGLSLKLPFVQLVRLGLYQELGERFTLLGTLGWEDWSDFDKLPLSVRQMTTKVDTGWHDTYHFSLGLRYRCGERWRLQGGVTYDTSPVKASKRAASLPIDRQIRYAIGAQYQWSENIDVGGAFEYIDLGSAKIHSSNLRGDYERNNLFVFAFNLNWKSLPSN